MSECDVKGQAIRLLDVFALGPFMIWVGVKARGIPESARAVMIMSGAGTMVFNGANFLRLQARRKRRALGPWD